MSLDADKLSNTLAVAFRSGGSSYLGAAESWVDAYTKYAADANGFGGAPVIPVGTKETMVAALVPAFSNVSISVEKTAIIANALANAFTAYWLLPPIAFYIEIGEVPVNIANVFLVSPVATAALSVALGSIFGTPLAQLNLATGLISGAIDIFTHTVIVKNTQSGLVLPIS